MRPGRDVAGRHHVGVAGEQQMRAAVGRALARGVEIVDRIGAVALEPEPRAGEPERGEEGFEHVQNALFDRCDRGAPYEIGKQGDGGMRHGLVAQQVVDRGLRPGLFIDPLDDHRAIEVRAGRAVGQRLAGERA